MTCPCKTKLTEAQKTLHNETSGTNLWQSPVSEKAGEVSGKLSQSLTKIASLATILSPLSPDAPLTNPLGMALQASGINSETIQSLASNVGSMKSAVDGFKDEATRLSDPTNLMSTIGTMNLFGNIGCALGIEGLDIGISIGVVTENGKTSISVAGNVQANLDTMLDSLTSGGSESEIQTAINNLSSGIGDIQNKINESAGNLNGLVSAGQRKMAEAMSKITQFSQVNFLSNLIGEAGDPCNSLASSVKGNLVSQDFQQKAQTMLNSQASSFGGQAGVR